MPRRESVLVEDFNCARREQGQKSGQLFQEQLITNHVPIATLAFGLATGVWWFWPNWTKALLWLAILVGVASLILIIFGFASTNNSLIILGMPVALVEPLWRRSMAAFVLLGAIAFAALRAPPSSRHGRALTIVVAAACSIVIGTIIFNSW